MSFEGMTTHNLSSWRVTILRYLKREGATTGIRIASDLDTGSNNKQFDLGRVFQILLDANEIEFDKNDWTFHLSTPKARDTS